MDESPLPSVMDKSHTQIPSVMDENHGRVPFPHCHGRLELRALIDMIQEIILTVVEKVIHDDTVGDSSMLLEGHGQLTLQHSHVDGGVGTVE